MIHNQYCIRTGMQFIILWRYNFTNSNFDDCKKLSEPFIKFTIISLLNFLIVFEYTRISNTNPISGEFPQLSRDFSLPLNHYGAKVAFRISSKLFIDNNSTRHPFAGKIPQRDSKRCMRHLLYCLLYQPALELPRNMTSTIICGLLWIYSINRICPAKWSRMFVGQQVLCNQLRCKVCLFQFDRKLYQANNWCLLYFYCVFYRLLIVYCRL